MLEARDAIIGQYIAVACRGNFLALFILFNTLNVSLFIWALSSYRICIF